VDLCHTGAVARRFALVLIWLALTAEMRGFVFAELWETWLTVLGDYLWKGIPFLRIPPWHLMVLVTCALSAPGTQNLRVREVTRAIQISLASIAALWIWGVVIRGGDGYQTIFQLHAFVMSLFVALLVAMTCRTKAHVIALGRVVVFAALYRSVVLFIFYFSIARHMQYPPAALTDHCDSVLFVCGLFVVIVNVIERRTAGSFFWLLVTTPIIVTAIVLNNRRIAWLDLGIAAIVTYALLPKGKIKRRITWGLVALSPALIAYVAAGWGRPVGIFKPVGSISTMFGENQDVSSIMRDIENYNLMRTLKTNPLLGAGWGHEYIEEVRAWDISGGFPQYRYLPHNSLLGAIAFTGMLGFAAMWQFVPAACYLNAVVYRESRDPVPRVAALSSLVAAIIIMLQMWGDVGFNHLMVTSMLGIGVGLGARLPVMCGLWPGPDQRSEARKDV
jgi:O-antigen ligase/polysaccharide polymerase Wzy-like membrane protein